jgi:hypothetical protein
MANASTGTTTYASTTATRTQSYTVPRVATKTQQISRYLADDLCGLVEDAQIDLKDSLGMPPDGYTTTDEFLAHLICNDIEQMLRDGLITGVHFLLSEDTQDPNTGFYNLRYHVEYQIDNDQVAQRSLGGNALQQFGERLTPPSAATVKARFALLIDWSPRITLDDIKEVQRPRYFFDWLPANNRFDGTSLVRFSVGGLGTEVTRIEYC